MMSQFQDKGTEFAAYRMLLVGVNVVLDMLIILLVAIAVPQINPYVMCLICLIVGVATLVFQVRIDHTLIFTGQFLVEDEDSLYVVIGIFGLGFGKRHRRNRKINSYRYYYLDHVRDVVNKSFGIRVKADVYTATSADVNVEKDIFDTPGAMKKLLLERGKRRSAVFRIEHNLARTEEARLLETLDRLKQTSV